MNRTLAFAAAAAAVVLVAVVAWQLLPSRGPSIGGQPTPSPTATTSAAASPTEDPDWWLAGTTGQCGQARVAHGCAGPLAAGTYTSGGFKPAVTYTVPTGWVNLRDWAEYFQVFPDTPANRTAIVSGDPTTQILVRSFNDAPGLGEGCAGQTPPPGPVDAAGLAAAAGARFGAIDDPAPTTVGDLSGYAVDLTAVVDVPIVCPGATVAPDGGGHRLIVVDGPAGTVIAISLDAPSPGELDAFLTSATPIVESMTFATEQ